MKRCTVGIHKSGNTVGTHKRRNTVSIQKGRNIVSRKRIKTAACLAGMTAALLVTGVRAGAQIVTVRSDQELDEIYRVVLEEVTYQIPCALDDLTEHGWELAPGVSGSTLMPGMEWKSAGMVQGAVPG